MINWKKQEKKLKENCPFEYFWLLLISLLHKRCSSRPQVSNMPQLDGWSWIKVCDGGRGQLKSVSRYDKVWLLRLAHQSRLTSYMALNPCSPTDVEAGIQRMRSATWCISRQSWQSWSLDSGQETFCRTLRFWCSLNFRTMQRSEPDNPLYTLSYSCPAVTVLF